MVIGTRFSRLVVREKIREEGRTKYICDCDCGGEAVTTAYSLNCGKTKSCGSCIRIKHGYYDTCEYHSWQGAKSRCLNVNDANYDRYGGRGVTICERWLKFENFIEDMGPMPEDEKRYSIERKDNNKGYEPGNCMWATADIQNTNKPYPSSTGIRGIQRDGDRYQIGLTVNHKLKHFGRFATLEEAKARLLEIREMLRNDKTN